MVKNLLANTGAARDPGLIPGSERYPGRGSGNPFQYSYLKNSTTEEPGRLHSMELQRTGHN